MRYCHFPILLLVISFSFTLPGQESCYEGLLAEGIAARDSQLYNLAFARFQAAEECPDIPTDNNLEELKRKTEEAMNRVIQEEKRKFFDAQNELYKSFLEKGESYLADSSYDNALNFLQAAIDIEKAFQQTQGGDGSFNIDKNGAQAKRKFIEAEKLAFKERQFEEADRKYSSLIKKGTDAFISADYAEALARAGEALWLINEYAAKTKINKNQIDNGGIRAQKLLEKSQKKAYSISLSNQLEKSTKLEKAFNYYEKASKDDESSHRYYKLAYAAINSALQSKSRLLRDDLLGMAYEIKAHCEWKLGNYNEARTTALDALHALIEAHSPSPHAEARMVALPGFIDNDIAYDSVGVLSKLTRIHRDNLESEALATFNEIKRQYKKFIYDDDSNAMAKIESALKHIDDARKKIPPQDALQLNFILTQMASLKNWRDVLATILNYKNRVASLYPNEKETINTWCQKAYESFNQKRDFYLSELEKQNGSSGFLYNYWAGKLGGRRG